MITTDIKISNKTIGVLSVSRLSGLTPGKDCYKYTATYEVEGMSPFTVTFKSRYSQGCLNLLSTTIRHLTGKYPVLKMSRPDRPPNKVRCRKCRTTAWSRHRHEYVPCKCGAIAVDGGYDYQRLIGESKDIDQIGVKEYERKVKGAKKESSK